MEIFHTGYTASWNEWDQYDLEDLAKTHFYPGNVHEILVVSIRCQKWFLKYANLFSNQLVWPQNSSTFQVACVCAFSIAILILTVESHLDVSWQNHRILHVSWQNWTKKQCPNTVNAAAKKTNLNPPTLMTMMVMIEVLGQGKVFQCQTVQNHTHSQFFIISLGIHYLPRQQ